MIFLAGCKNKVDEAYELKQNGFRDKAIEVLNQRLDEDPLDSEALFALGNINVELGNWAEALHNFNDALKIEPDNLRFLNRKLYLLTKVDSQGKKYENDSKVLVTVPESTMLKYPGNSYFYSVLLDYYSDAFPKGYYQKEFLSSLTKHNQLKPFSNWVLIYSNNKKKTLDANSGIILSNSLAIFDTSGNPAGQIQKDIRIVVTKVIGDSIFFIDPNKFKLEDHIGWRIDDIIKKDSYGLHHITDLGSDFSGDFYKWPGHFPKGLYCGLSKISRSSNNEIWYYSAQNELRIFDGYYFQPNYPSGKYILSVSRFLHYNAIARSAHSDSPTAGWAFEIIN